MTPTAVKVNHTIMPAHARKDPYTIFPPRSVELWKEYQNFPEECLFSTHDNITEMCKLAQHTCFIIEWKQRPFFFILYLEESSVPKYGLYNQRKDGLDNQIEMIKMLYVSLPVDISSYFNDSVLWNKVNCVSALDWMVFPT